jgi:hypothetical protein
MPVRYGENTRGLVYRNEIVVFKNDRKSFQNIIFKLQNLGASYYSLNHSHSFVCSCISASELLYR